MKTLVFVRGVESNLKREVVATLMNVCNPDLNSVSAIRVAMDDYIETSIVGSRYKPDYKAASSSCKRLVRTLLSGNHNESVIIIDNESLSPQDWEAFIKLSATTGEQIDVVGIDVADDNINTAGRSPKSTLQTTNRNTFIVSCRKYYHIHSNDDLTGVISGIILNFNS